MEHPTIHHRPTLGKRFRRQNTDYKIACLVPLGVELAPLRAMLDEIHDNVPVSRNQNAYTLGSIGQHDIVIATLPSIGNNDSGVAANQLRHDFPSVQFSILVGIAGGVPDAERQIDIRLGDVVVSEPNGTSGGVLQFDRGKRHTGDRLELVGHLNKPPQFLIATVKNLKAQHLQQGHKIHELVSDMLRRFPRMKEAYSYPGSHHGHLYRSDYEHVGGDNCQRCAVTGCVDRVRRDNDQIKIHYGTIGSSNTVIRNAMERDRLGRNYKILSVEMEAAGLMDTLPSLVVRGICDYADSHKNKRWQPYAAATAAAYVKELILSMSTERLSSNALSLDPQLAVEDRIPNRPLDSKVSMKAGVDPEGSQLEALLESLTFDRMDARLQNITEALPRTCKWLFQRADFQDWSLRRRVDEHRGFFWIKGKPGSGKSTMMKTSLKWARRHWQREVTVSYFFNARASGDLEKSSLGFYRSLAHQILYAYPTTHNLFLDQFQSKVRSDAVAEWTVPELQNFLQMSIQTLQNRPLNLFIDALDEGQEDDIRQLVAFLEDLALHAASSNTYLRICLSSRHFPHVSIKKGFSLVMEEQLGHKEDIELYIMTKLSGGTSTEMEVLRNKVLDKSANVFLWVVLVVPILNEAYDKGKSIGVIMRCLEDIPIALDDLFARILGQSNEELGECLSLLQWVLFAHKALSPVQLSLALKSSFTPARYDDTETSSERLKWYLLNTSRGLTEITKSNPPIVQFIHETVREFLKRKGLAQIDISIADNVEGWSHEKLKSGCLQYVMHYATSISTAHSLTHEQHKANIMETLPFMEYAVEHVFRHAELAERYAIPQQEFLLLCTRETSPVVPKWVQSRNAFKKFATQKYSSSAPLLYIIVEQGLEILVQVLLNDDVYNVGFDARSERYGSVLQAACALGSEGIVRRLLDAGADVNSEGGAFKHALLAAVHYKRDRVMRLLIQRGANPTKSTLNTPFSTAVARGYLAGIETLLGLGVDINHDNRYGRTPLSIAIKQNYVDIVKLLIHHGANVNHIDRYHGNALQLASQEGHRAIVELLMSEEVDIDIQYKDCGTALRTACVYGHKEVVEQLVANGADVNTQGRYLGNALLAACYYGRLEIVELLLSKGADINTQGGHYGNALQAVCKKGNEQVIRYLISKGVDINTQGGYYGSALQAACLEGNEQVTRYLISKGANVNLQGGHYGSALQAACFGSCLAIVELLLSKGADINTQGGYYGSALQAACLEGNEQVIRHLISEGANVNIQGGCYGNALQAACRFSDQESVKFLLSKGADVNARGGTYGSALQAAQQRRNSDIIRLLEAAGATG